jgi:hypothetical protein
MLQRKAVFTMYIVWYLFFIICAVFYDLHRYDLSVLIRISDQTQMIEQALQQIPTCTPDDRSRQRALLHTLQAWTHLAHPHHVRYWISRRALVSQTESHGSLPYSQSIDVSMLANEIPQLIRLIKVNTSSTYELQVHPQWNTVPAVKRSLFPSQRIDWVKYPARFINREKNVSINIQPVFDSLSDQDMLIEYDTQTKSRIVSEDWIFPLHPCLFAGVKVWCPAEPRKLATSVFDPGSTAQCINGAWVARS